MSEAALLHVLMLRPPEGMLGGQDVNRMPPNDVRVAPHICIWISRTEKRGWMWEEEGENIRKVAPQLILKPENKGVVRQKLLGEFPG